MLCVSVRVQKQYDISGYVPNDLASAKLGAMNHARWLILASRILRYYVSDPVLWSGERKWRRWHVM